MIPRRGRGLRRSLPLFFALFLAVGPPLAAYIGPGAGFAFLSSFLVFFVAFFLALFSLLAWPFRAVGRLIRGRTAFRKSLVDQVVVIGLDGLSPELTERFLAEGKLPRLAELKERGPMPASKRRPPPFRPWPGHPS